MHNLTNDKLILYIRKFLTVLNRCNRVPTSLVRMFISCFRDLILSLNKTPSMTVPDKSILEVAFIFQNVKSSVETVEKRSLKAKLVRLITEVNLQSLNQAFGIDIHMLEPDDLRKSLSKSFGLIIILFSYLLIYYQLDRKTLDQVEVTVVNRLADVLDSYFSSGCQINLKNDYQYVFNSIELKAVLVHLRQFIKEGDV